MTERVLLVDDEPGTLELLQRVLTSASTAAFRPVALELGVHTACGGEEALRVLQADAPFAVIVSDFEMPGMTGTEFLERARAISPDSVRIMLTGSADLRAAAEAINRGAVFRFLTKPCVPEMVAQTVNAAMRQYQLVIAEQQLLEQTLAGSVRVLTELLTLVNPVASSRALRVRRHVRHIVKTLGLPDAWEFEMAALLSHLGCVALSLDAVDAASVLERQSDDVRDQVRHHPAVARDLLAHIPRLERVSEMIGCQQEPVHPADQGLPLAHRDQIRLGGQILRVAIDFDAAVASGLNRPEALARLRALPSDYSLDVVNSLLNAPLPSMTFEPRKLTVRELATGMLLEEDLHNRNGLLLMSRGQEITRPALARIHDLLSGGALRGSVCVSVLAPPAEEPELRSMPPLIAR